MIFSRTDRGTLQPAKKLPNGQLLVDGFISRSGVFTYQRADGSQIREYRSPAEVFSQASMDSFANAFITNDHPETLIDVTNAKGVTVGVMQGAPKRDGDMLRATLLIFDGETIVDIEAGKRELSSGYTADVHIGAGVSPEGEHFDAAQKDIAGNHVAIVEIGRAGSSVRLRLDEGAATQVRPSAVEGKYKMDPDLKTALADAASEKARADMAEKALTAVDGKLAETETKLTGETARADASEKARTDSADKFDGRVQARVALVAAGQKVLGDKFDAQADDNAIRVACIAKLDGSDMTGKDGGYITAYFDSCMKNEANVNSANADLIIAAGAPKGDAKDPGETARAAMVETNLNAWQN